MTSPATNRTTHPFSLAGLAALSLLACAAPTHAGAGVDNYVIAALERIDDCTNPSAEFGILLDVALPGSGATAVEMTSAAGLHVALEQDGDDEWYGEATYPDLSSMANETNGLWTVTVTGGAAASTSTFTLNVAGMDIFDFYAPPANVLPASGSIGANATFTWDDPTAGQPTPEVLLVDTDFQAADLSVGETSWTPPLPLTAGPNSFAVSYGYTADLGTAGPLMVTSGSIAWGLAPFAPAGYPAATPLAMFGSETIRCYDVQGVGAANTIEIAIERIDDFVFPENQFLAFIDVRLADDSVEGIEVVTGNGSDFDLDNDDDDFWEAELGFSDLASMINMLDGEWTLTVTGETSSVSTFTLNIGDLVDGDFFDVPTNLSPGHNDAGVPANVILSWDNPTPPGAADVVFVETNEYDANTVEGTLNINATSWAPPAPFPPGDQEFFVGYAAFAEFGGPISVDPPGAIAWGLPSYAPPGHPANSPLCFIGSETAVQFIVGEPANFLVALERLDDPGLDGAFAAFIDADLPGLDPTSVEVRTPGLVIPLDSFEAGSWEADLTFNSLEEMRSTLNGTWFIEVFGPNHSLTQFHLDLIPVVDGDFYPTPFDVFPGQGEVGVPADVTFSWADPTGQNTPDVLFVETFFQEASTFDGTIDIAATEWTPPFELDPGFNEFLVAYLDFAGPGTASPMFAVGPIGWQTPDLAPGGYPEDSALVLFGAETGRQFEVGVSDCPADVSGDGVVGFADILAMLGAWGPCEGCPEDADQSGDVGFSDVLLVLSQWGPCE